MDTTIEDIWFDENGVCKFCYIHDEMDKTHPLGTEGLVKFNSIIGMIKESGKNKKYDCIVGVSGGRDSTYTLLTAAKSGLKPLAVHFDNGWNSKIAVENIQKATTKLNVDLHTIVADWEEMKALQRAFLKASVPDADVPTDYAIYSVLFETAFSCKIFDSYGSEGNSIIFECPTHSCYHSTMEYGITEILDENDNKIEKGSGRLISTDLWNFANPFIRYDTQDLVELYDKKCNCKRSLLPILRIIGRDNDVLEFNNVGRFIVHNFTGFFQNDNTFIEEIS